MEFLDVSWRTIQHYGVEIDGRRYDGPGLNLHRGIRSRYGGAHPGRWPIMVDRDDVRTVFFQDPDTGAWHDLAWEHAPGLDAPFSALREAGHILLESTPKGLDLDDVRAHILALPHVQDIHDLHASTVATGLPVLTAHVVLDDECFTDGHAADMLAQLQDCVAAHFAVSIEHSTFQLEPPHHAEREHAAHA